ncbi:MAG: succinate dehydrogenase cytochrome b subunit [Blastocatellia bacterium]
MAASAQSLQNSTAGLLVRLWRSSIGKKYVMAVTGLGLWLFVMVHLAGNLQVFLPPSLINTYAHTLKANPLVLWGARLGLLAIAALHIIAAIQLALANRRARPVRYDAGKPVESTFAQRTIVVSGLIILAFIAFHLSHFTIGLVDPQFLEFRDPQTGYHDVHRMMVAGFSNCYVSGFYVLSMGLLMLHLSHGISSLFQSLGLRSNKTFKFFNSLAHVVAIMIFIGNCSIPLAIMAGWVK